MEEYDLSYRVIAAGFSIGYEPGVTIEHKESRHGRLVDHAKLRRQWTNKTSLHGDTFRSATRLRQRPCGTWSTCAV